MSQASRADTEALPWWKTSVFYQIYPRSFLDTDGNGIGDLQGIRRRLGHLAWLGVDPLFGSLDDFDRLLADAHRLGLRVMIDWVPNHTSDQHPWFAESRSGRLAAGSAVWIRPSTR